MNEGNVVAEMRIGNTNIKICDDYCRGVTPEETDAVLKRVARRAAEAFNRRADEQFFSDF